VGEDLLHERGRESLVTLLQGRPLTQEVTARTHIGLTYSQRNAVREVLPQVRVAKFDLGVHRRQKLLAHRLRVAYWPSLREDGSSLWPSSPTLSEWMEMTEKGAAPCSARGFPGKTCRVPRTVLNNSSVLAQRIVSRHIIGIRSDIEVPEKFLGYFRYRRGFLILTAPKPPIGLARFLLGRWCVDPTSLWLEWYGTLKQYLREVPFHLISGVDLTVPDVETLSLLSEE